MTFLLFLENPEDALLQQALAMSLSQQSGGTTTTTSAATADVSAMTEEEQLEYALRMSLAQSGQTGSTPAMDEDMKDVIFNR
jgi:hypothetical protein